MALTVQAHKFSGKAAEKIAAAGGAAEALAVIGVGPSVAAPVEPWKTASRTSSPSPDLRNRVLFTLGMLGVYRVGHHITVPGVNIAGDRRCSRSRCRTRCSACTTCSPGGNLSRMTIFALGIMPYISASIILQLLTVVWPYLERLSKEGELGRRKITPVHALRHDRPGGGPGASASRSSSNADSTSRRVPLVVNPGWAFRLMTRADAHHRHLLRDVARRADHRARHRQRHVAHHLRRHRRRAADAVLRRSTQIRTRPASAVLACWCCWR